MTFAQDVTSWGYKLDKHLDEFEDFVPINKDSRILDVAAGTGLIGQKAIISFVISSNFSALTDECAKAPDLLHKKDPCNVTLYCNNGIHG